eukprot:SAG31_NODE_43636_length_266_cov_0.622754_1_plen_35_part_01
MHTKRGATQVPSGEPNFESILCRPLNVWRRIPAVR